MFQLASDLEQHRQRGKEACEHVQSCGTPSGSQARVPEKHREVLAEVDRKNSQDGSHFSSPATTWKEQWGKENGVQVKKEEKKDKGAMEEW